MKKILVPVDFSKPSMYAVEVAADIARKSGAKLILLHVVEEIVGNSINIEGQVGSNEDDWENRIFTLKLIEKAKKQMAKLTEDSKLEDVKIIPELRVGTPYHGMNQIIVDQKVDLVVMGTAGQSDLAQMIIGSNTEKVVRTAHCPVLTVHSKPVNSEFKEIVYASSLNKDEEVFSRIVRTTQKLYDSTVHMVKNKYTF